MSGANNAVDLKLSMLAQAEWLGLTIDPAYQAGVVQFLTLSNMMAQKVLEHPLTPLDEPANVFTPVAAIALFAQGA